MKKGTEKVGEKLAEKLTEKTASAITKNTKPSITSETTKSTDTNTNATPATNQLPHTKTPNSIGEKKSGQTFIQGPFKSIIPESLQTQESKKKPENNFLDQLLQQTKNEAIKSYKTNSGTNTTKSEIPNTPQSSPEMSPTLATSTTLTSTPDQTPNTNFKENVTEKNQTTNDESINNTNNSQQNSINPNQPLYEEKQVEKDNLEPTKEIPTPPPLPYSLLTSPKKNSSNPITPEVLIEKKTNLKPINSQAAFEIQEEIKKNLKPQIPPNTIITPDTLADSVPDQIALEELKGRQIIKDDENIKPEVRLLTENNEIIAISKNNFPVKLTPKGHGYLFSSDKEQETPHNLPADSSEVEFKLGILKQPDNAFLFHGKQTHILVAIIHNKNETDPFDYGIFSLTSKKNENILSKVQYDKFEKMQENNNQEVNNDKTQYIMPYSNLIQIPKDQITFLKWGSEYLNDPQAAKIIDAFYSKLQPKKAIIYDNKGLTKEDLINICKQHDTNIKNKNKHPQTTGQIEVQQKAKEKQQQEQEAKKKEKEDKKNKKEEEQTIQNKNETNTSSNE